MFFKLFSSIVFEFLAQFHRFRYNFCHIINFRNSFFSRTFRSSAASEIPPAKAKKVAARKRRRARKKARKAEAKELECEKQNSFDCDKILQKTESFKRFLCKQREKKNLHEEKTMGRGTPRRSRKYSL